MSIDKNENISSWFHVCKVYLNEYIFSAKFTFRFNDRERKRDFSRQFNLHLIYIQLNIKNLFIFIR